MTSMIIPLLLSLTLQGDVVAFNLGFDLGYGHRSNRAVETTYDYYNLAGADDYYTLAGGDTYQVASH